MDEQPSEAPCRRLPSAERPAAQGPLLGHRPRDGPQSEMRNALTWGSGYLQTGPPGVLAIIAIPANLARMPSDPSPVAA